MTETEKKMRERWNGDRDQRLYPPSTVACVVSDISTPPRASEDPSRANRFNLYHDYGQRSGFCTSDIEKHDMGRWPWDKCIQKQPPTYPRVSSGSYWPNAVPPSTQKHILPPVRNKPTIESFSLYGTEGPLGCSEQPSAQVQWFNSPPQPKSLPPDPTHFYTRRMGYLHTDASSRLVGRTLDQVLEPSTRRGHKKKVRVFGCWTMVHADCSTHPGQLLLYACLGPSYPRNPVREHKKEEQSNVGCIHGQLISSRVLPRTTRRCVSSALSLWAMWWQFDASILYVLGDRSRIRV